MSKTEDVLENKPKKRGRPRKIKIDEPIFQQTKQLELFNNDFPSDLTIFKDDISSMEHPFFSPSKKPEMDILVYKQGENTLKIIPNAYGRPIQADHDFIIYLTSLFAKHKFENPDDIYRYRRVRVSLSDYLKVINKKWASSYAEQFENMLLRLTGSIIHTNIRTRDHLEESRGITLLESYRILKSGARGVLEVEVTVSEWLMRHIRLNQMLTIDHDYFSLSKPLEKKLYEIVRKHCGTQLLFRISLEKLKDKMGVSKTRPLRLFKNQIKTIVKGNAIPRYDLALDIGKNVLVVTPKDVDKVDLNMKLQKSGLLDWYYDELYRGED